MNDEAKQLIDDERKRIVDLLRGIDKEIINDPAGWWETSEGAKFGASILEKIMNPDAE